MREMQGFASYLTIFAAFLNEYCCCAPPTSRFPFKLHSAALLLLLLRLSASALCYSYLSTYEYGIRSYWNIKPLASALPRDQPEDRVCTSRVPGLFFILLNETRTAAQKLLCCQVRLLLCYI